MSAEQELALGLVPPPEGATTLITDPRDPMVYTARRETDARTALTRGLAEYLQQMFIEWPGGRRSQFKKVLDSWAEPEQQMVYPSATVYSVEAGQYADDSVGTQSRPILGTEPPLFLRQTSELTLPITIEARTTDPVERMALAAMLEDMLNPVDWMSGCRLRLPHYFGVYATYLPGQVAYEDSETDAQRRWRRVVMAVSASCPVIRMVGERPLLKIRTDIKTTA